MRSFTKERSSQLIYIWAIKGRIMGKCMWCNYKDDYLRLKEYKYWNLYLAESQSIIGWSHVVLQRHIENFEELTDSELIELKKVVSELKAILKKAFYPDLFNIIQAGNMVKHLHIHIVPRYKTSRQFEGRTFQDPDFGKLVTDRWKKEDKDFLAKLIDYIKGQF